MVKLVFLGTGGWISSPNRNNTSFLIRTEKGSYLFEAGEGIYKTLQKMGLFPLELKAGFITHVHADHVLGLPSLILLQTFYGGKKIEMLMPEFAKDWVEKLTYFIPEEYKKGISFNFFEPSVSSPVYHDEEMEVYAFHAFHTVPAVSYSIHLKDKKLRIFYTGDTASSVKHIEFMRNADVVIHEASIPDGQEDLARSLGHATPSQAINVCLKANVKRLFLVHLGFQTFKQTRFDVNGLKVIVPFDGEIYEF